MTAYEEMIRATAAPHAPWFVVPADHKWFTRLVVSQTLVAAIEGLRPRLAEAVARPGGPRGGEESAREGLKRA